MRKKPNRLIALTLGLLLVLVSSGSSLAAQAGARETASGSYIVVFRSEVADAPSLARDLTNRHGVSPSFVYQHALKGFAFRGPEAAAQAMARNPNVAYVEPDGVLYALGQTVPTGVKRMDAHLNATAKIDGNDERVNVDVAVLDTGVAFHSDLNVYIQVDCTNESSGPPWSRTATCVEGTGHDGHGHGTHVAGSIAALDNAEGVVGVAPGARIWGIKVLEDNGSGSFAMIIAGVDYVAANAGTIKVANMSLGGQGESQGLQTAIANAVGLGVTFVVAAGNSQADVYGDGDYSTKSDNYVPASYPEVMTISALADSDGAKGGQGVDTSYGPDDTLATFSNFSTSVTSDNPVTSEGKAIDVAAPGVDILSTYNDGGYATMSGTSMASPHAAGMVALHIAAKGLNPTTAADVASIRQAIIDSGQAQSEWRTSGSTNDTDGNYERMAYAGDGSGGGGGTDPTNNPPSAQNGTASTNEDTAVTITLTGSDAEDCSLLTFSIAGNPANGTVGTPSSTTCDTATNTASATVSYTPNANYNGSDSFAFRVTDSAGAYADGTVSITVNAVNDAPVANGDSATTTKNTAVTIDVLANDSDVDGDSLTVSIVSGSGPSNGMVTVNTDKTVTYTPNTDFVGTDSFVYQITDPGGLSSQATVSITVEEPSTGWSSGDLESSVWSDSGNPNGKYSSKDYSFTPALGAAPTQMTVSVNVSSWAGDAATLGAYIKVKGTSYWVCDVSVSGTGLASCNGTLSPGLVVDGASNTLRLTVGPLTKGESFEVDMVEVNLQ
ncbi:MAG: S8 family serine peptidase [Bacillota bacterium]